MIGRNMVFISHRKTNDAVADMINDFLVKTGTPGDQVFCSSLPGNDVHEAISKEVKSQLKHTAVCILVLSKEYYESAYCQHEAGVAWYIDGIRVIPIGLPEIDETNMPGFIGLENKLRRLDNEDDIAYLYDEIQKKLKTKGKTHAIIARESRKLIKQYGIFLSSRGEEKISNSNNITDQLGVIQDLENEIKNLKEKITIYENEEIREYQNEYNQLKKEALFLRANYAEIYSNIIDQKDERYEEAIKDFHNIASRFDAFSKMKQPDLSNVPTRENLKEVSGHLFGLSRGIYLHKGEDPLTHIECNDRHAKRIIELLCDDL